MIYDEIGSGGVNTKGCAYYDRTHIYTTKFGVGDILYNIYKARRGKLEKVVIKQILPIKTIYTGGQFKVMYKDTLNGLWNEWDLVILADAKALSLAYYEALLEDLAELQAKDGC